MSIFGPSHTEELAAPVVEPKLSYKDRLIRVAQLRKDLEVVYASLMGVIGEENRLGERVLIQQITAMEDEIDSLLTFKGD